MQEIPVSGAIDSKKKKKVGSDSSFGGDNRLQRSCACPCPSCWTRHMHAAAFSTATGQTSQQQPQNKHHMVKQSKHMEVESKHSCKGISGLGLFGKLL